MGKLILWIIILAGIWWVVANFWPFILGIGLVGGIAMVIYALRPPPDPKNEINKAAGDAEKGIGEAGKAYRKRVKNLKK